VNGSDAVTEVLVEAQRLGFLGPRPVEVQLVHAQKYVEAVRKLGWGSEGASCRLVDIGSGGGVPGLVLATELGHAEIVLVDASQRRCSFLTWAVVELGISAQVTVVCSRAEEFGHDAQWRSRFDIATARGFGPPAWTVECAAPLLRKRGVCLISEPPNGREWPSDGLLRVGMCYQEQMDGIVVLNRIKDVAGDFPRGPSRQKRDPLFIQ